MTVWGDKSSQKATVDFAQFHEERIAVVLNRGAIVFCGTAMFQRDDDLGNILRIKSDSSEACEGEVLLSEGDWQGRIIPDLEHGCRYCFIP